MKGRIFGVMAAATLGLTSLASAGGLDLSSISPPGAGNVGSEYTLWGGPTGSLFSGTAATSGSAENLSSGDLATLVGLVSPVAGQVYVFAVGQSADDTSLVILAGGSFNSTLMNAGTGDGVFQTGGVNVSQVVGGGFTSGGTLNTGTGSSFAAFVYDDMDLWSNGSITLYGGGSGTIATNATVNFLSWNSGTSTYDTLGSSNMDGSMAFNFQVVPVPAPALLAGVGLLGAGIVRRRMARN
jgi:hypothetical protein